MPHSSSAPAGHHGAPIVRPAPSAQAWNDLHRAMRMWRYAFALGWLDIKLRYRGSVLGPFWLTLSSVVMLASMGVIYARLFGISLTDYLPFLAISLTLWQVAIAGMLQEACICFTDADRTIRAIRLPLTLQAMRVLIRNAIVLAHNIVVPIGVFALYRMWPGIAGLLAVPGLVLWAADAFAACLLLGAICARFRDLPPIVGALLQVSFYVTPVVWRPAQLGSHQKWLVLNPFFDLLEIVRAPLLGHVPPGGIYAMGVAVSLVLWVVTGCVFSRARRYVAFWV